MPDDVAASPRPSGSQKRQRSGIIGFRANAAERAELERLAERAGLSLSSYVRSRALAEPTTRATRRPPVERAALSQILYQLGKCGSNLNQIARALNSGAQEAPELAQALAQWNAMSDLVLSAMGRGKPEREAA